VTIQQPSEPNSKKRLLGKVAVVTGAASGLGQAEALLLADQGASVVVNGLPTGPNGEMTVDKTVEQIQTAGGTAVPNHDDVSESKSAETIVQTALDTFGRLDILINNAGVISGSLVEGISDDEWDHVLDVHLRGTFLLIRNAVPHFKGQRSGVIVNTCSESGLGHPTASHYAAAKEGIAGLTRSVAREVGGFGIRCNAIRPRALGTPMGQKYRRESAGWTSQLEALGQFRLGERGHIRPSSEPKQVVPMVVWLCTDAASKINGVTFQVEGNLIGVWSEPSLQRSLIQPTAWDLDSIDSSAPGLLTFDMENRFRVEFHPGTT
jgi:NAD(P)-dependent dehydrogenase (short-subunit alcohol dehydrogenase family)